MRKIIAGAAAFAVAAHAAASFSGLAFNNATVQPGGPRSGENGKRFFNIQGKANGRFASWGVADFRASAFGVGFTVADVFDFKVVLTQANAAFTKPGNLNFWLTPDSDASIDPGVSTLVWQEGVSPEGVGSQLSLVPLGSGVFTEVSNGHVDTFDFALSAAAKSLVVDTLNSGGILRLVITADTEGPNPDDVAATYAGFSNTNHIGPRITFDAVPVPEPATLFGLGALATLLARRRRA